LVLGLYHVAGSKGKKSKRSSVNAAAANGFEMGTANGPVDYEWIPKETLQVLQKTPSPRSARRRAKKAAAGSDAPSESE